MRVCIFGDSHVACFKQAWDALDEKPDGLSVDFVASPGLGLAALQANGETLGTTNEYVANQLKLASGGHAFLRASDFDAFLMVGLGLWVGSTADGITRAVFEQGWKDLIGASLSLALAKLVRSQANTPIYVAHNPLPATTAQIPTQRTYDDQYAAMKAVFDRHDIRLLRQPAETVLFPAGTHNDFRRGATHLWKDPQTGELALQPAEDVHHMNAAYAQIHFREFFKRMQADGLSVGS